MPTTLLRTTAATLGLAALTMAASLLAGCSLLSEDLERVPAAASTAAATPVAQAPATNDHERPAGWREESHSNDADPNYDVVFPIDAVNMITITLAPDDWAAMQADMEELYGADRDRAKALAAMTDEERAAYLQQQMADAVAAGDVPPSAEFTRRSPIWLPVTISFQGQEWTHVGVRYKGASSLGPWMEGEMKLPFKFDFDEFEDDYPAIKNQRFFGFKQLSLANNYEDAAGMRDTLVYELLADAGLPSLRTAPVEIVLDNGEGPLHLGLYTLIEVVDDTGVSAYFGSDDGNIYEANGLGAGLAKASATQLEASFEKKNNEDEADWSDIRALYDLLHSDVRTSDPAAWRADLEAIFDVDGFLEWLGIAAIVGHGDTYGVAGHNFYLYNDPAAGRLTWFSWDHNVTFRQELMPFLVLDKSIVTDHWPLIRFLLDDPVYWARYVDLMAENYATVLAPDALLAKIRGHAEVIAPVATQEMSQEEYAAAVQELVDFVTARAADVEEFLAQQE
ncbi:CotH kinase family protein [Caldilinea sp.]|uniref:CotH kinase family protein n=1 Tax=Caldilinea sp. TaxID=2293560 RepID=UPI002B7E5541|nr:CotH kinase family protein [Caldilinea sp.]